MCPGTTDFKVVTEGKLAFEEVGPGEVIAFASCMKKGTPIGFPCPHFEQIKSSLKKRLDGKAIMIDWTH